MEIERKFIPLNLPENLESYEHKEYAQGYLNVRPVVRARREGDKYVLTYKSSGFLAREEYNLPLTEESFNHLIAKADGNIIEKTRYFIPLSSELTAELDIFKGKFEGLKLVEVEFRSVEDAKSFTPPSWFGSDVTMDKRYHNSFMSQVNDPAAIFTEIE